MRIHADVRRLHHSDAYLNPPLTSRRAILVNSGNANAFTGKLGEETVLKISEYLSVKLDCDIDQIYTASTGVIGEEFPVEQIRERLSDLVDKLRTEHDELIKAIADLKDILDKKDRRMDIIKDELIKVKEKYGDERRSQIDYAGGDFSIEDIIPAKEKNDG